MSHDIGSLRGLMAGVEDARVTLVRKRRSLQQAINDALAAEFGPADRDPEFRAWVLPGMWVNVDFDQSAATRGMWSADAHIGIDVSVDAQADTPRSAVTQALAALALTHPNEAAALAAVIPEAP
jgi:hypothetical protein